MVRRPLISLLCLLALAGCADPPGIKKPLPIDYQEQTHAQMVYHRVGPQMATIDGVVGSYLTQHNNPRRIVCVVKDKVTREQLQGLFGKDADGVRIRYEIADKGFDAREGIEQVRNEDLPTTWWGKVVYYFKHFATRVMPTDLAPPEEPPPGAPVPEGPQDPSLKST